MTCCGEGVSASWGDDCRRDSGEARLPEDNWEEYRRSVPLSPRFCSTARELRLETEDALRFEAMGAPPVADLLSSALFGDGFVQEVKSDRKACSKEFSGFDLLLLLPIALSMLRIRSRADD